MIWLRFGGVPRFREDVDKGGRFLEMKIWEMSIWIEMGFWFSWMEISKGKAFEKD